MDILISSNLERLLFEMAGRDSDKLRGWMERLMREGVYEVDAGTRARMAQLISSGWADDAVCCGADKAHMGRAWLSAGYAYGCGDACVGGVSRAHRRPHAMRGSGHGQSVQVQRRRIARAGRRRAADAFECAAELERRCGVAMPRPLSELKQLPERHNKVVDAQGMDAAVLDAIAKKL